MYAACNAGIFPVGQQGGWLAPFELLCSKNPIVVSNEMGASSIIKEFNLGIVTDNYADALYDIYKNKKKYKKQAERAAEFIRKNLGWNVFADKMIKAFKDAWRKYKR